MQSRSPIIGFAIRTIPIIPPPLPLELQFLLGRVSLSKGGRGIWLKWQKDFYRLLLKTSSASTFYSSQYFCAEVNGLFFFFYLGFRCAHPRLLQYQAFSLPSYHSADATFKPINSHRIVNPTISHRSSSIGHPTLPPFNLTTFQPWTNQRFNN